MASNNGFRKLQQRRVAAQTMRAKFQHVYELIGEMGRACETDMERLEAKIDALSARVDVLSQPSAGWFERWRRGR